MADAISKKEGQPLHQFVLTYLAMDRLVEPEREDIISSFVQLGKTLLQPNNEHYVQAMSFVGGIVQMESDLLNTNGLKNEQLIALKEISDYLKSLSCSRKIPHLSKMIDQSHKALG